MALYDNSATAYLGYYYKAEVIDNHGQIVSGINIHAVPAVNTTGTVIYQFQRANDNSGVPGPYSNIGTASTSLEYNDTTVVPGTIYWYRVVATDDSNGIPVASTGLQITIPAAAVN